LSARDWDFFFDPSPLERVAMAPPCTPLFFGIGLRVTIWDLLWC